MNRFSIKCPGSVETAWFPSTNLHVPVPTDSVQGGQGLLAAPCTSQACVHRRPFPLLDTLTPVPSVSSQTSLLSGESLSNPSPSVTLTTAPPTPTICSLVSFMVSVTQKSRVCSLFSVLPPEHKSMEGGVFILFPTATMMLAYMRSGA